ncbi:hypothetical protein LP415_08035 [Polaromonas sp. P1(28)-8]|nr:hypothetical protein LP415_08035 [Polaromonas sp. P1(28)-8]
MSDLIFFLDIDIDGVLHPWSRQPIRKVPRKGIKFRDLTVAEFSKRPHE